MPRDASIRSVLVIGSGPIVIGQACEFDYSGTQAIKVLRKEGIRVSLVNSNPATIMTDPEFADRPTSSRSPRRRSRRSSSGAADALLPTVGGQTALNLAVELPGAASRPARRAAHRREPPCGRGGRGPPALQGGHGPHRARGPRSVSPRTLEEAKKVLEIDRPPAVIRPLTLGDGGGIAYNLEEFEELGRGIDLSPVHQVLIEESVLGWRGV
jgi:carbamoyl-phosphate synthase large subunit